MIDDKEMQRLLKVVYGIKWTKGQYHYERHFQECEICGRGER